jgi:molybdate transport system substrate-binding protein
MNVLSGGAIQKGLESAAQAFAELSGEKVFLSFATAPVIRDKVKNRNLALDLVIAPSEVLREFERLGFTHAASSVVVGRVKAGVAVRQNTWQPDIATADSLKAALIACESIVYNQGSSGIFAEELLQRLGIAEAVKDKTIRLADAGAVMRHLAESTATREIAFGQITAILLHASRGIELVGSLPGEVENITTYEGGIVTAAAAPELAQRFLEFLATPSAKAAFRATGVD